MSSDDLNKNIDELNLVAQGKLNLIETIDKLYKKLNGLPEGTVKNITLEALNEETVISRIQNDILKNFDTADLPGSFPEKTLKLISDMFEEVGHGHALEKHGSELEVFRRGDAESYKSDVFYLKVFSDKFIESARADNPLSVNEEHHRQANVILDAEYIKAVEIQATAKEGEFRQVNVKTSDEGNPLTREGRLLGKTKELFEKYSGFAQYDNLEHLGDYSDRAGSAIVYIDPALKTIELMRKGELSQRAVNYHYNDITTTMLNDLNKDIDLSVYTINKYEKEIGNKDLLNKTLHELSELSENIKSLQNEIGYQGPDIGKAKK